MAREQNPLVVLDDASPARLLAGATVEVRHRAGSSGTDGTLAPVYAAETGAGLVAAPFVTNVVGRAVGYHEPGKYRLTAQHGDLAAPYVEDFDVNPYDASFASGLMPTAGEKAALAGTSGTPGDTNRYVTKTDQVRQAKVVRTANQLIPNVTVTPIEWTAEAYDLPAGSNQHDNVTNNTRLTCPEAGLYLIGARVLWILSATGERHLYLRKNGLGIYLDLDIRAAPAGYGGEVVTEDRLVVGDYIEALVFQGSGAALNVDILTWGAATSLWWERRSA